VLHGNTSLRVSYIASRANHLSWGPDLNQPRPVDPANPDAPRPNPFPAWSHVFTRADGAISTYESLQTEVMHKYSHGLTLQSTWTWARNLSDTESFPRSGFSGEVTGRSMNQYNLRGDYGNVGGTRKHRWVTTMVDELPIGQGHYLLGSAHGLLNAIVGGWRLSTILLVQSGPYDTPFLFFDSSGNALFGGFNRPDIVGNPNKFNHTAEQWWDPNAFACPGGAQGQDLDPATRTLNCSKVVGRFGNAGVGSLIGPKTFNLSTGLAKINYDDPRNNLSESGTFGKVLAARTGDAGGNRVGQLALRVEF